MSPTGAVAAGSRHATVVERPGGAAGKGAGNRRRLGARGPQRVAVERVDRRLRAAQEGGADLHAPGAETERRGQAAAVADAPGRDHRNADRVHHLRHQRERADGPVVAAEKKAAAVAAGLGALGDHRVGPALGEMLGLGDRRRTRQDAAARRASRVHGRPIRQAEVEAGHGQPSHRDARAATPGRVSTPTTL